MIGPFGGINEEAIHTLQSRFQILRCRELSIGHQLEMDQGIVQNRRELMQVFIGFRACHLTLLPEHIKGGIRLVIIEDKLQFIRHGWQFPFGTTARFTPSRAGCDPVFIRGSCTPTLRIIRSAQKPAKRLGTLPSHLATWLKAMPSPASIGSGVRRPKRLPVQPTPLRSIPDASGSISCFWAPIGPLWCVDRTHPTGSDVP